LRYTTLITTDSFEDAFRYDADGLPRVWQKTDNIDRFFVNAKEVAEELIVLYAKIPIPSDLLVEYITGDLDYDEDAQAIIILPLSKQRDLKERLKRDADTIFMEVKRGAVASLSEVPRFVWLLLLVFGFNEIWMILSFVLSNPFLLILILMFGATGYLHFCTPVCSS
jgi:hypothetical protein